MVKVNKHDNNNNNYNNNNNNANHSNQQMIVIILVYIYIYIYSYDMCLPYLPEPRRCPRSDRLRAVTSRLVVFVDRDAFRGAKRDS